MEKEAQLHSHIKQIHKETHTHRKFWFVITARPQWKTRPEEQDLVQIRAGVTGDFPVKLY